MGGEGRVEASVAELGRVDAREKGWGWSDCRRGVWRSLQEKLPRCWSGLTLSKVATKSRMRMRM